MAKLLNENWGAAAGLVGALAGDRVEVRQSELHGLGVFATSDLAAGEWVTLYPVHRVLQTLGDGRGAGSVSDEEDEQYFNGQQEGLLADERVYRQVAYRQTYSHPDPNRPETFQLDANAAKKDRRGWIGHRLNDGATLRPDETSEEALLTYYEESAKRRNCCAVALCVPLIGFVTTTSVAEGEELLTTCALCRGCPSADCPPVSCPPPSPACLSTACLPEPHTVLS